MKLKEKVRFAMAFHCYQPVFNFDEEFEKAYNNAYLPLMETLEKFPKIKTSFHFSGNMLEWFERKHPEYIELVKRMVRRGQIELIGGGCFEPVMVLIPERDRKEQLRMNNEIIARIFGVEPKGAWIAERVWEPALADTLHASGAEYTIVDDYHVMRAGIDENKIFKPYRTKGEKGWVTLFPSLTQLRYSMPFRSPKATLAYIKETVERDPENATCFFFADDGEKFGAWPYTYHWVHKRGWLKKFFNLLEENNDWLETATYSEVMDNVAAEEIDNVPESSYAEMMEWSGGNFRNFFKKYPEADRMRKRMLSVSDMIDEAGLKNTSRSSEKEIQDARKELFKAQSSCAYWHGTFGGVYLPHLRSGVYEHLIKAQNMINSLNGNSDSSVRSVEYNTGESILSSRFVDVFVKPLDGGTVDELDYKPGNINLINTLSRTKEKYHRKLRENSSQLMKQARKAIMRGDLADIHDVLGVGERGLSRILHYDDYQKNSFRTHIFRGRRKWDDMCRGYVSDTKFLKGQYAARTEAREGYLTHVFSKRDKIFLENGGPIDLKVVKKITIGDEPAIMFSHKISDCFGRPNSLSYAVEFNFLIWDKEIINGSKLIKADRFKLKDQYSGIVLDFFLDKEYTIFRYPVYSINETESGLKKMFQGVSVFIEDKYEHNGIKGADEMKATIAIAQG